jgi:RNase adaptor protein for sRNA GlmZ degradation
VRVIYCYWRTIEEIAAEVLNPEVYLLSMYAKNDQSDMTAAAGCGGPQRTESVRLAQRLRCIVGHVN